MDWSLSPLVVLVLVVGAVSPAIAGGLAGPGPVMADSSQNTSAPSSNGAVVATTTARDEPRAATTTTPTTAPTTATTPTTAPTTATTPTTATETDDGAEPGALFAGAVGVHNASLHGDVQERAFRISVAGADTPEAKARIVSERVADVEQRIAVLDRRQAELQEARDNGTISPGEYRARRAVISAEANSLLTVLQHAETVTVDLPTLVLDGVSVDLSTITSLQSRARALVVADSYLG